MQQEEEKLEEENQWLQKLAQRLNIEDTAEEENSSDSKRYCVYVHIAPNLKTYVGVTSMSVNQRWRDGEGYNTQPLFYRAIKKYGWDNFKHIIIAKDLTAKQASKMEIMWINVYKSFGLSYNVSWGGEGVDKIVSEESKRKMSAAKKGIKHGPMSEELKRKLSNSIKGKNVGKVRSKEFIYKQRISHLGKVMPEDIKKKIAESHYKPVIRIDLSTGETKSYPSINDAAIQMGDKKYCNNIANCIHGRQKTAMGYNWEFQQ